MGPSEAFPLPVGDGDDEYALICFCTEMGCFGDPGLNCPGDVECPLIKSIFLNKNSPKPLE